MNRAIIFPTLAAPAWIAGAQPDFGVRPDAEAVLDRYCFSCHEDGTTKGDVQLDNLASLKPEARLDLLNRVQEQLVLGEMPPKKKKQPSEEERDLLVRWISGELRANHAATFEEKLRMPDYGNVVDHGKLFSGKYRDLPGSTPDRRWLISEFIFDAKFNKLLDYNAGLDIDGKRQKVLGENGRNGLKANLTNPFLLPKLGNEMAIGNLMQTLMLRTDFVYRQEFGEGEADEHGRRMLSPHDASYTLAYALTDSSPDKELQEAVKNGKLNTREDYRREVERMLKNRSQYYVIDEAVRRIGSNDSFTNMPIRELRFFREFFGYPALLPIFKDNKRFGGDYVTVSGRLVSEADLLVEHILEQDRNVFETLLGTEEFYVFHSGDNPVMAESSAYVRKIYDYFKDKDWENFDAADLKEHLEFLKANEVRGVNVNVIAAGTGGKEAVVGFKTTMSSYRDLLGKGQANAVPFSATQGHGKTEGRTRNGQQLRGPEVAKCFNFDLNHWDYPTTQPTWVPHRKGILTHPAWLVAFAGNTATDPIRRGKWVREKLLAGVIPDVPVTVDAVIPEDHTRTMRQRLESKT